MLLQPVYVQLLTVVNVNMYTMDTTTNNSTKSSHCSVADWPDIPDANSTSFNEGQFHFYIRHCLCICFSLDQNYRNLCKSWQSEALVRKKQIMTMCEGSLCSLSQISGEV